MSRSNASLILILGDQLSTELSSLRAADRTRDHILMAEVADEATYVPHHKKKIAFVFSAMRHFAAQLRDGGWTVDYVELDDAENSGTLAGEVQRLAARRKPSRIVVTEPGEWRLFDRMRRWKDDLSQPVEILDDDRFLCSRVDFADWAHGRKELRMEYFYREMRRRTGLLMCGDGPEGGRWNFDAENRKPPDSSLPMAGPKRFVPDAVTADVLRLVERRFGSHFGALDPFWFGVSRQDALDALDHFIEASLPSFGDFQDAMLTGQRFLFHSVLSLYINAGLLGPLEVCRRAEAAYHAGNAPLNAAEGFIRQIIGWREYVRGLYWLRMPGYVEENFFDARRPLPDFYWTADTDMRCMREAILQTKEEAYAHHIQRLMITGNFAMLAGVDPRAVHEWYLAVYADAYEWVELPNTLGMSQYADGGLLGSKPYAASGNYINRMSDYCTSCRYDVKQKTGEGACPFNALYWHFLDRNALKLRGNRRLSQIFRTWDRMDDEKRAAYRESAEQTFGRLIAE